MAIPERQSAFYWASRLIIPAIMVLMVGRASYLSSQYELSTWKGGGMGMFASADSTATRYAQTYLVAPNGERYPIFRLKQEHSKWLNRALWYPTRENFIPYANAIRSTQWASNDTREQVGSYDNRGNFLGKTAKSYELLSPVGKRPRSEATEFVIVIDYHTLSYDVEARTLKSRLIKTFRFETME